MKRILFTHSYFLQFDPKQWQIMQPYAPLGTITAAAVVREAGYDTYLWDPMFSAHAEELSNSLDKIQPDALVIYDDGFNYLTKMCLTNMREAAFQMIRLAAARNIPVIVSSSDATDHYEKYLDQGAKAIIKGEGEKTLVEYLNTLKKGVEEFENIQGLCYRKNSNTIVNQPGEVLHNLDALPMPAWDLVDVDFYKQKWISNHGYFSINMNTTRGCPFKCNWCAKPIYGNRYNSRSPEHVVNEIKFLKENYEPYHIWFCDDIFGLKPGWVQKFSERLNEAGIKIKYKIQSRVDLLLQENTIVALAASGCETAWVGAESGSQAILDAMDKGTKVEQIYEATHLLKKHHIKPAFFLQFGYPGETNSDIQKTIKMVKSLLPDDIGISVSYPLPGTKFYDKVKAELQQKSNWSDSDELAMMFTGTYPPGFYKHLHRFVHKSYRIHQGTDLLKKLASGKIPSESIAWKRIAGTIFHQPGKWYHKNKMNRFSEVVKFTNRSKNENETTKKAFDIAAVDYDNKFTESAIGKIQRKQVHHYLKKKIDPVVYPNILELNCGTGTDAIWFSQQGFSVLATDLSGEMIRVANQKGKRLILANPPEFKTLGFDDLSQLNGKTFDLVFSNFGGLNCADSEKIKSLAKQVHELLRPGGKFIAVVMGRKCLLENVYFRFKNKELHNRRKSESAITASISNMEFPVWYYSPDEFAGLMKPFLNDPICKPVGLFTPPSFTETHFSKSKTLISGTALLEKIAPALPGLADYADHYLIELTRR